PPTGVREDAEDADELGVGHDAFPLVVAVTQQRGVAGLLFGKCLRPLVPATRKRWLVSRHQPGAGELHRLLGGRGDGVGEPPRQADMPSLRTDDAVDVADVVVAVAIEPDGVLEAEPRRWTSVREHGAGDPPAFHAVPAGDVKVVVGMTSPWACAVLAGREVG